MDKAKPGQYLTLMLNNETYALPIEVIREINRVGEITPVPRTPPCIKGVMNLRGKIVPVLNLRINFSLPDQGFTRDTCIVVIEAPLGQVGVIVDAVKEVVELKVSEIEPTPQLGHAVRDRFITGLGKIDSKVLILIDIVSALSFEDQEDIKTLIADKQAA